MMVAVAILCNTLQNDQFLRIGAIFFGLKKEIKRNKIYNFCN